MFNSLKEKLKNWIKKSTEEVKEEPKKEIVKTKKEKQTKKTKQVKEKKTKPEVKEAKIKEKKKKIEEIKEELTEKPEEAKEEELKKEIEKKKSVVKKELEELKIEEEITESLKEIEPEKKGFFTKFKDKFKKEKQVEEKPEVEELKEEKEPEKKSILSKIISKHKITEEEFKSISEGLEMILLENNVALEVVENITKNLSEKLIGKELKKEELEKEIISQIKNSLNEILIEPKDLIKSIKEKKEDPFVILFFGINGTGKTTTIAKIANLLKKNNLSLVIAAGDTFRAASIEQIQIHADKLSIPLIKHEYGADPASVGFDAIKYAKAHKINVVLIDTAGRMYTKSNLLSEMEKIVRVTKPDLKLFVAESIAGNDAIEQAKSFNENIGIDGSILTKADVDEKGGAMISIGYITKKPIFYLGVGQNYDDIEIFNKEKIIKNLGLG
jgi:fused signal recognition particle receptor